MKRILSSLALIGLATPAVLGASLTTFRVCEEKRTLKTSDGADAGHVEYIVVDPGEQRVVSAVVTGGVIGQKFVTVPFSTVQYGSGNDIVLERIDRQRLVSAPVIEERYLTSGAVIEPAVISKSYSYFGVEPRFSGAVNVDSREVNRSTTNIDRSTTNTNVDARGREMKKGERDAAVTTDPGASGADTNPANRSDKRGQDAAERDAKAGAKNKGQNADSNTSTTNPGATATDPSATGANGEKGKMDKAERDAAKNSKKAEKDADATAKDAEKSADKADKASEKAERKGSSGGTSTDATTAPGTSTRGSGANPSSSSSPARSGASSTDSTNPASSGTTGGAATKSGTTGAGTGTSTPSSGSDAARSGAANSTPSGGTAKPTESSATSSKDKNNQ